MSSLVPKTQQALTTALLLTTSPPESDVGTAFMTTPQPSTVLIPVKVLPTTPLLIVAPLESTFPAKNRRVSNPSGRKEVKLHIGGTVKSTEAQLCQHAK